MRAVLFCLAVSLLPSAFARAEVRLPNVFSDHAVLQRDKPIKVWGWAEPGENVRVSLAGNAADAAADNGGVWKVELPPLPAGGPHELTASGKNTVKVVDLLVGEVWVCSGQSNMEFELKHAQSAHQEIKDAGYPKIRLLHVPRTPAGLPLADIKARWFVCSPTDAELPDFSAVGYFFAREIHKRLGVPVGMITAAQGATQIEIWTPPEGLAEVPALKDSLAGIEAAARAARTKLAANLDALEAAIPAARAALAAGRPLPAAIAMSGPLPAEGGPLLYNGMIHPLAPFAIRGALWYQGESNCGDGMRYCDKMKALVGGWRKVWGQGDFSFYSVQITPNNYNGALPLLIEAQIASMAIPNTGVASSTHTCDASDHFGGGHPRNKQEIGRRLALWALAKDYGIQDLVYSGPQFKSAAVEGRQVRLRFDHVGSGLATRDGKPPDCFEIAGADGKFEEAAAQIDGPAIVLTSDKVANPTAVRFSWKDLAQSNLINKEGLPALLFRAEVKGN